ncbi:MAG TPA: ABC transporter permease [Vicinamibacterales bacterium]|nr:ABC transporter permease [Vicinamibacterales bacterium]
MKLETRMMLWSAANELKHASRMLARHPGYAAAAALTLALGIGATVAIFTVVNAVLLRPLPYPASDRIVVISQHAPGLNMADIANSPGLVREYGRHARSLAAVGGYRSRSLNFSDGTAPERLRAVSVTPNLLTILSVHPAIGRSFQAADAQENAPQVAILTDALWRTRFGGDPSVIGHTVRLDGRPAEVIGVMPPDFEFVDRQVRLLLPLRSDPDSHFGEFGLTALARLAPSASVSTARNEIQQLQSRIPEWFPDMTSNLLAQFGWSVTVDRWRDRIVADISRALWVLLATVGFVLLIAVTNVANLFLVRAEARQREIALRSALGAGRARVAGVFLAESLVLAALGGAVGVMLAAWSTRLLVAHGPAQIPRLHEVHFDARVGAFAAALTLLAGIALGLLAAAHAVGRDTAALVREGGRGNTAGRGRHRVRRLLLITQMATAVVLLVASGLLVRTVSRLAAIDPGFDAAHVVTAGVMLGAEPDRNRAAATYRAVLAEMARLPGVESVGATSALPIGPTGLSGGSFDIKSRPSPDNALPPFAMYTSVTFGYFETLRIPLLQGRLPERADIEQHRPVVWVNRTLMINFLGDHALGESIKFRGRWFEIVGVVGDVKTFDLRETSRAMAYVPMGDPLVATDAMFAVIRTRDNVVLPASALRAAVDAVDRSVPLTMIRTMKEIVDNSLAQTSFTMVLLTIAALTALALGVVGLYGVISYVVSQRTAEIGIRLALGARPADVYGLVLGQGLTVAIAGVVIGLAGAAASARFIRSLLFEVSARDPATYAAAAIILTLVSIVATYVPARRAAAIDPSAALRMQQL